MALPLQAKLLTFYFAAVHPSAANVVSDAVSMIQYTLPARGGGARERQPSLKHSLPPADAPSVGGDICMSDVQTGKQQCKFISQVLCKDANQTLANATGDYARCLTGRRTSCALVGSGFHLLNASFGEEINGHQVVIRMNSAPAGKGGLAEHVGNRTDVRFLNALGWIPAEEQLQPLCLFLHEPYVTCYARRRGQLCWRDPLLCRRDCSLGPSSLQCKGRLMDAAAPAWGDATVILDHVLGGVAHQVLGNPLATAGFKALLHALRTCDKVSVYGFGPDCTDGNVGERYYTNVSDGRPAEAPHLWHDYGEELDLIRGMSRVGPDLPKLAHWTVSRKVSLRLPDCLTQPPMGKGKLNDLRRIFEDLQAHLDLKGRRM